MLHSYNIYIKHNIGLYISQHIITTNKKHICVHLGIDCNMVKGLDDSLIF